MIFSEMIDKTTAAYWLSPLELTKAELNQECESRGMKVALLQNQQEADNLISIKGISNFLSFLLVYYNVKLL